MTDPLAAARHCDAPGCTEPGEYRAPRSRSRLDEYLWFCLPHVREYNAAWDYYKGMDPAEIEANLRADAAWQRPSWPLGRLGGTKRFDPEALRDPLGLLGATPVHQRRRRPSEDKPQPPAELRAALDVLGLGWPVDAPAVRARYKELAKRYHPDANGGDRAAEDRLKDVNRAYSLLRRRIG
ncbi:MAG TPA: J domain-containing protein, partial [Crenalkalicoccus sp.]|nr:J domain-containing protein [Crenalkalicoccus sp.]